MPIGVTAMSEPPYEYGHLYPEIVTKEDGIHIYIMQDQGVKEPLIPEYQMHTIPQDDLSSEHSQHE